MTALIGSYGVSYLVVAANVALAAAVRRSSARPALVAAAVVVAALAGGVAVSPGAGLGPGGGEVRLLQPNIPNLVEWDQVRAEGNYQSALAQADAACEAGALVILPESALWPYVYGREPRLAADLDRLAPRGCRLFLNSIIERPPTATTVPETATPDTDTYYNSALLIGPQGVEPDQHDIRSGGRRAFGVEAVEGLAVVERRAAPE